MKRIAFALIVIMTIVFAASCELQLSTQTYKINSSECGFITIGGENIVELGTEFDVTKIKIEREPLSTVGSEIVTIPVTENMVSGDYSTDTVGEKKIVITAVGETFELTFHVKYGVKFMVSDEVVSQQYLEEGEKPEIPDVEYLAPAGTHFAGWSPAVPAVISENMVFTAQYAKDITPPSLKTVNAIYGQTLSELTLPKNSQGEWKFVDDADTFVGNVGSNEFDVEFVPKEEGAATISGVVTVKVSKAKIQFKDLVVEFIYDGTAKYPTYTVPDGVTVMEMGDRGVEAGTYDFTLSVSSNNYDGYYFGQYVITKAKTTVTLPDYELTFDQVKSFKPSEYTVTEGFDKALLGDVTLVKPNISGAGEYQITVEYTNVNNVTASVLGGKITVTQSTFNPDDLVIEDVVATFGDRLGDIELSEHGSGTWSWKYPELYINTAGKYTATVVFTPNNAGYQPVEKVIDITVNKKELSLSASSTTLVYNGTAQAIPVTSYVVGDGSYANISVKISYKQSNADATPINAGKYDVTIEIVDDRYYGTANTELTIEKATPVVDFTRDTFDIKWSPDGRVLANVDPSGRVPANDLGISGKYSWKNGQTSIAADENIGVYVSYPVIFTPDDQANYNAVEGELRVRVIKADGSIKTADNKTSYEFSYNGEVIDVAALVERGHIEAELEYSIDLLTVKNVGRYVITVTLPETAHYSAVSKEITVVVKHGEYPFNQINIPSGLVAVYGDTLASVVLPADAQGEWRWKDASASVGNAGERTYTAIFKHSDEGYSELEVEVTVAVAKRELTLTPGNSTFIYDGNAKSVEISIDGYLDASHRVDLVGNASEINAGNYTFTVTVSDNNYSGSVEVTLVINKADYIPGLLPELSATYGDTLAGVKLPEDANGVWAWALADTTSVGDAGSAGFKAIFTHNNQNYNAYEHEFTVNVSKQKVTVPADETVEYNGVSQTSSYESNNIYTVENARATVVGRYTVTFTLRDSDNYEWADGNTATFTITKAENCWITEPALNKYEWTYGEAAAVISAGEAKFGNIIVSVIPEKVGTYYVTVSVIGTANYTGVEAVAFTVTINKAKVTLPDNTSVVYTGAAQTSTYTDTALYTVTNVTGTDVGDYTVTFALRDSANYEWADGNTATFTIAKATNKWTTAPALDKRVWTYGDASAIINSYASAFGTASVTLDGAVLDGEIPDLIGVGEHTLVFTVADTDNYAGLTASITFTVNKAANAWITEPTIDKTEWIYGEVGAVVNKGASVFGEIAVSAIPTTAGEHIITVSVADTANYAGLEVTFEVTINKAKVTLPDNSSVVYNGAEQTSAYEDTELYTVTNAKGTDVGDYTVTFALVDSDNYEWADGNTVTYTITKATNKWTTAPALDKAIWTYGDASATVKTYASAFGTASVTLDGVALEGAIPALIDAGAHTLVFTVEDTDNYAGLTATVTFTVNKAGNAWTTEPTIDKTEWIYGEDGAVVNKGASVFGEIVVSAIPTTAGEHIITVSVADTKNYAGLEMTFEVTINKAKVTLTETNSSVVYNGTEQTSAYEDTELYTVTNVKGTAAGDYTVTFALRDTANYEWDGANTVTFTITKAKVTAPEVMTTVPYDGDQHGVTLDSTLYAVDSYDSDDRVAAGEYIVTLKLTDSNNYEWNGANTTKLVITKSTPTLGEITIKGWVYGAYNAGNNAPSAKVTNIKGVTVTFSYWNGDVEITDLAALVPGTYTLRATVADCDNYSGASAETTFKVDKISVSVPSVTGSYVYNGNPITAEIASSEYYDITTNSGYVTAGEHNVVLTLKDSALYRWATDEEGTSNTVNVPFTIAKAQSSVSVTIGNWNFGSAASVPTVNGAPYDASYTIMYVGTTNAGVAYSSETAPTEAGNYEIIVTVGETDNCLGSTNSTSFEITRKTVNAPTGSYTEEYDGKAQTPSLNTDIFVVGNATDVGEHQISVTLRDTNNYEWSIDPDVAERYVTLTITKATTTLGITVTNKVTYTGYAYDGLTVSCNIAGDNVVVIYYSNDGGVTWTTDAPKNVGLYYVYAEVVETDNYTYAKTDVEEFTIEQAPVDINYYDYNATEQYQNNVIQSGIAIGADGKVVNGKYEFTKTGKFTPSISSSAQGVYYTLSFTPYDNNYKPVNSVDVVVYLKPAAYITTDGVKTYYGSIEDALAAAKSGDVVWTVIDASGDNVIANSCTIKAGVTLVIPYAADVRLNGNHKASQAGGSAPSVTVTNTVTIAAGKTLTVIGNLEVSGQLYSGSGGALSAGHTHGKTAQIVLSKNAKIVGDKDETSAGVIELYGFIEELTKDNGSMVVIKSGAKLYMPLIVRDFRGGTISAGVNGSGKNKASVFNQMAFVNITPSTEVQSGGSLYGMANMYASDDYHASDGFIIGDHNSTAVIKLDQGSIFKSKYNKETDILKIDIYGGASTSAMKITVGGTTVSTGDFAFAMSYHYDITLKALDGQNNVYNIKQLFKLLPGAKLTVDPGVTLNITNMNIYDASFRDNCTTRPYPTANPVTGEALEDAKLIVYGTLTATNLGGNVYIMEGATFDTSKSYSSETWDIITCGTLGFNASFDKYKQNAVIISNGVVVTLNADGGVADEGFVRVTDGTYPELPTPTKHGYKFIGWYYGETLVTAGMELLASESHTIIAKWEKNTKITLYSMDTSETFEVFAEDGKYPTLPTPTKAGFTFAGWYFAGVKVASGEDIKTNEDHILVAKWIANDIKIFFVSDGEIAGNYIVVTDGKYPTLPTPNKAGYDFVGWYYGDTKIEVGQELAVSGSHVLTAAWEESKLASYTATFDPNGGICTTGSVSANEGSTITLPTPDAREGYTFAGWYTAASGGELVGNAGASYVLTADVTIYAQWTANPYKVTVSQSNATVMITVNGVAVSSGGTIPYGSEVSVKVTFSESSNKTFIVKDNNGTELLNKTAAGTYTFKMPAGPVTITASSEKSSICVTPDTLVTLADGTEKRIDSVLPTDMLLVWNFYTGAYDMAPASIIMNHGYDEYTVVTLRFADGTEINTINGHGFFDADANEYVIIDHNNVADYIGHSFVKVDENGYSTTELIDYIISVEYTESWSVLTVKYYNCILEDLWTVTPAEVEGSPEYLMPFEIGEDMRYDEAKMLSDIETYGLYTYADFAEYMSEEQYEALGLDIWKVSVGKGYITWDEILYLISIHIG